MGWNPALVDGMIVLNQKAIHLKGEQVSFVVHYWGAQAGHGNNKPHQHSFYEICYIVDGEGSYVENGIVYPLREGSLFLSRPYIMHQILSDTGLDIIFVAFEVDRDLSTAEGAALYSRMETTERIMLENAAGEPIVQLWQSLLLTAASAPDLFEDSVLRMCGAILTQFMNVFCDKPSTDKEQREHSRRVASTLVYQAKLYIRDNLSQPLRLKDVADYLHISGRHLSRIFDAELGQSFSSYVRKEKIRQAGILLATTDLTIKEISDRTGFDTVHYFTTVFTDEMGMPPGKFRKKFSQSNG
jgi:AraC-type DNA-binding domain-containing proteins